MALILHRLVLGPILIALAFASVLPAFAQDLDLSAVGTTQVERRAILDAHRAEIFADGIFDTRLVEIRSDVRNIRIQSRTLADQIRQRQAIVATQINELGETPEGIASDSDAFGQVRADLQEQSLRLEDYLRQSESNQAEAVRLLAHISSLRRSLYLSEALQSAPLVVSPKLWFDAIRNYSGSLTGLWMKASTGRGGLQSLTTAFAIALIFLGPILAFQLRRLATRFAMKRLLALKNRHLRQFTFSALALVFVALAAALAIASFVHGLSLLGAVPPEGVNSFTPSLQIWMCLIFAAAGGASLLAPRRHDFRVVQVNDADAKHLAISSGGAAYGLRHTWG